VDFFQFWIGDFLEFENDNFEYFWVESVLLYECEDGLFGDWLIGVDSLTLQLINERGVVDFGIGVLDSKVVDGVMKLSRLGVDLYLGCE
jgi:hypothetical protein